MAGRASTFQAGCRLSTLVLLACLPLIAFAGAFAGAFAKAAKLPVPTYAQDIRPILQTRCAPCHSSATLKDASISGGLALDSYDGVLNGTLVGESRRPIVALAKPADSELVRRLTTTISSKLMPRGGPPLPPQQIALFRRWIEAGAPRGKDSAAIAGATGAATAPAAAKGVKEPTPAFRGTEAVRFTTRIAPTDALRGPGTPKDATLQYELMVGPLPAATALAWSPDGTRLAVGGYRSDVLWDTTAGKPSAWYGGQGELGGPVQALAFKPDGSQLAVCGGAPGEAGEAIVLSAADLKPVGPALTGHSDVVNGMAWSADGARIATAGQDKTARIWSWPDGKELVACRDHSDGVTKVCWSPDGKAVYTACLDRNVRRFDASNGKTLQTYGGTPEPVTALAVSPDGKYVVSSSAEARIRWWVGDAVEPVRFSDGSGAVVNEIVFAKDGKRMASCSADHNVKLWDAESAAEQRTFTGATDWLYSVAISPDGKLVAAAGAGGKVRIWETETGRLRLALIFWPPAGEKRAAEWAAITPEGYFVASPGWEPRVRPRLAGQPILSGSVEKFVRALRQEKPVAEAFHARAVDPAKIPEENKVTARK